MRFVGPHKEITFSFVMAGLISEILREWHEEETRIRTTKRNRQMIFFFSISYHFLATIYCYNFIQFLFSFQLGIE